MIVLKYDFEAGTVSRRVVYSRRRAPYLYLARCSGCTVTLPSDAIVYTMTVTRRDLVFFKNGTCASGTACAFDGATFVMGKTCIVTLDLKQSRAFAKFACSVQTMRDILCTD